MAPEKAPAFQFYPKDFLLGTATMSLLARGAYITLLAYQWDHGSVPTQPEELGRVWGVSAAQAKKLWADVSAKFRADDDGFWRNQRLEAERLKQEQRRAILAANGRKGGRPQNNQTETNRFVGKEPDTNQKQSLSSASSSASAFASSSDSVPSEPHRRNRGAPPLHMGLRRLKIWRWMIEEFISRLGTYADEFDIDVWIRDRDEQETRVIQSDGWWEYWLSAFDAEVRRRGLPIVATPQLAKTTTRLAAALANIKAAEKA